MIEIMGLVTGSFSPHYNHVILDLIRSFGFLNLTRGPWVAGGSVRRIFENKPYDSGDVDIFFKKDAQPLDVMNNRNYVAKVMEARPERVVSTHDGVVLEYDGAPDKHAYVQLVRHNRFATVEDLINDFDYTICMAATDGYSWIADERFFTDLDKRYLRINNSEQRRKCISRLAKYCLHGFTPLPGVINTLVSGDTVEDDGKLRSYDLGASQW